MKNRLSRFVAEDPKDLSLRREEAIRLSTEAFRLWAVAAGYGQACDLYRYGVGFVTWCVSQCSCVQAGNLLEVSNFLVSFWQSSQLIYQVIIRNPLV